jgi:hypothetical protein
MILLLLLTSLAGSFASKSGELEEDTIGLQQSWTWLEQESSGLNLRNRIGRAGLIQLSVVDDNLIIDAVREPSDERSPVKGGFCENLLPAALEAFFNDNFLDVTMIRTATVTLDDRKYCECIVGVISNMGFGQSPRIYLERDAGRVTSPERVFLFCEAGFVSMTFTKTYEKTVPKLPATTDPNRDLLNGATFKSREQLKKWQF